MTCIFFKWKVVTRKPPTTATTTTEVNLDPVIITSLFLVYFLLFKTTTCIRFASEFLIENFTEFSPKISKISSIYTRKKNPNFFVKKKKICPKPQQVTYNKCFIMVTHHFVSTCQDKAEPFRTMEWWSPYPLCWVRCQVSLLSKLYHPWMNPSILPSIYPQWWYCTSFEIAQFAHHSSHNPFTWILPPIYTYTHIFVSNLSLLLPTNVWHKIILKKSSPKKRENCIDICWNR